MRLENRVAIVTGAASGIGRAVARKLAAEGARLVIGDRNVEGAEETAGMLDANAVVAALDVSDEASCRAIVDQAVERHGALDIVCNIAGVLDFGRFADVDRSRWDRVISVNLTGVYHMCRAAMPHLIPRRGTIINMASAAGLVGVPYNSAYTASKHGVIGLTRALALEFSKEGVRINAVCPGGVRTPMLEQAPPEDIDWQMVMRSASWLDGGEIAEPSDIADTVAFLASDEARRITGAAFTVDGGQTAG
ncbi:NAD(P)-dependent dehydrogenase (short-subunit alcohol dehydrogenase family) [Sphingobium sp. OAS761]|uniref:SDR family NAD(P)-dependent oxidoreductase n=1 Tax=Sphingobium sp. OAS761 TaxID=2817901 RepID=UPI00209D979E|nr:SDR family NAD(P)-dependent oxidoreductase [Sphingobium sp. OAS761]MCP1470395.1 NAD(P)-dependent dehydrogenase (short-subunit alcohol dehydrogenase family) [Sphingobium sp. OAS761]